VPAKASTTPRHPPKASSEAARAVMRGNRRRDTGPERVVRSALHRVGLRFRVDLRIEAEGQPVRPDVVFPRQRVAVFIDGCFWHGCPDHGTRPTTNSGYWLSKIEANRKRDHQNTHALRTQGWTVLRVWEHEDPRHVADVVARAVRSAQGPKASRSGPRGQGARVSASRTNAPSSARSISPAG